MAPRISIAPRMFLKRIALRVERLEGREVPNATAAPLNSSDVQATVLEADDVFFSLNHSGYSRVDANTTSSPYAGVGSILINTKTSSFMGTGTVIGPRQVLTAAHIVDLNNDGKVNERDRATGTYFILNFGGDETHRIAVERVDIQPNFTGFNRPAVNDDLAILTLAEDVPDGVPIYPTAMTEMLAGSSITMVGYGRTGNGVDGYLSNASLTVKRVGQNVVDAFYIQDDKKLPIVNEVFRFDFDGPSGNGPLGGSGLALETQLGHGDSGGPSFAMTFEGLTLIGVNTFVQGAKAPKFGSMGGGVNLYAYRDFIQSVLDPSWSDSEDELPSAIGMVPGLGPIIGTPPKKGIGVGAKKISFEFALESIQNVPPVGSPFTQSVSLERSAKSTDVQYFAWTPTASIRSTEFGEFDPLAVGAGSASSGDSLAISSALFEFASGEVLSVE